MFRRAAITVVITMCVTSACTDAESEAVVPPEVATPSAETCPIDDPLALVQSGMATIDYEPAGSLGEVDANAQVAIIGRVASVVEVGGNDRPDIDVIAFESVWADHTQADPLAEPVTLTDVHVFAFLSPWSGRRGGWNPGAEGLYLSCGLTEPLHAAIADGAGPNDPTNVPVEEMAAFVAAERARRQVVGGGSAPGSEYAPDELRDLRERSLEADPAFVTAIRDGLVHFARGEDLAIGQIPLDRTVALGLGSDIDVQVANDDLIDRERWVIDRPEGYAEFAGPFSALETLARVDATQILIGDHAHCAGSPLPRPDGFEDHALVSIQPVDGTIDSCIAWYAIDLFLDPQTLAIGAITLNLFGP